MSTATSIEQFSLYADGGKALSFEQDMDLHVHTKAARGGGRGSVAAVVLVELGIDGYEAHRARLDYGLVPLDDTEAFRYDRGRDEVRVLTDAIDALTALRDELARMTVAG